MAEKEFEEKSELTPIINTNKPQTKLRGANDTQYFTGIDVVSNGSTTLSADVIDSDARVQISDIADFVGYLSYLDGVNYKMNNQTPTLENGRFWGKWQNSRGIIPLDNSGNKVKVNWAEDWELGYAVLMKSEIVKTEKTIVHGRESNSGYWCKAPVAFLAHTYDSQSPYGYFTLRVSATTCVDADLWQPNTGFSEGMLPDTWYFVKASYDSSTHTASITATKDFVNWSETGSVTQANKTPYTGSDDYMCFAGHYPDSTNGAQNVILDLANCYIKQNGIMIWGHYDGAFAGENHYQNPAMPWRPLQDGYSNFWFELTDDTLSPWLNFSAKNNDAVIDWGDGSGEVALDTLSPTHTYSKAGRYVVKVKGVTGIARQYAAGTYASSMQRVLKHIELNSDVNTIADYGFMLAICLEDIVFSGTFTSISTGAFQNDALLKRVEIPEGVARVSTSTFNQCFGMQEIILPSTITNVGVAFASCFTLDTIHCKAISPPTLGSGAFSTLPTRWICYVPVGTGDTYKAAADWSAYADHILEEGQQPNRAMLAKFNTDEPQDEEMR